ELIYKSYISKKKRYDKSFRYRMGWQKVKEKEYLFRECLDTKKRKSLGVRSGETEAIYDSFRTQKAELKKSIKESKIVLERQEKISKFTKISRVPNVLINLFRRLNELGLDDKVVVIGTNSLYAYEAYCGVFIENQHLATFDIDILNKRDKKVSIAFKEKIPNRTLKGILLEIDNTFKESEEAFYRFVNKDEVVVELLTPMRMKADNESFSGVREIILDGIKWIESSKLHKQLLVGDSGKCAFITTINPLEYAVYKLWLSVQSYREPMKRDRDLQQSRLVTKLIKEYMLTIDIESELKNIKNMSKEAIEAYRQMLD
ncbi:MAG: nucleotidyltransferase domain-containing protein, partial [Sulfurimonas sp.]|nr:nucleotidyltransferase domain-containing protein [Sulfurimonas sp.]